MRVILKDNELITITETTPIYLDLRKFDLIYYDTNNNLKRENYFIIKQNEFLAEHSKQRTGLVNYCPYISIEAILMNIENSTTNESQQFVFNLS